MTPSDKLILIKTRAMIDSFMALTDAQADDLFTQAAEID